MKSSPWRSWAIPAGILVVAILLRLAGIDKSLWADEVGSMVHARAIDFIAIARGDVHPPLYLWILRQLDSITHSFALLRLFSVACGVAAVAIVLRAVSTPAAWLAGTLVACSPEMTYHSQELRQYAFLNLLFLIALLCTLRLTTDPDSRAARLGLAVTLVIGTATHLVTGFFMVPLALLLALAYWRCAPRRLPALAALFIPATVVLIYFKWFFLTAAKEVSGATWWMAPADWSAVAQGLSTALGWDMVRWIASAVGRHLPGGEALILGAAIVGIVLVFWTAWAPLRSGLARQLLIVSLVYWSVVIAYSFAAVSILMPRIMVLGALPLLLSVAVGVTGHPDRWRLRAATAALSGYAAVAIAPWMWFFAWVPREDLRGLIETIQRQRQHEEVVIFMSETDRAADMYWPELKRGPGWAEVSLLEPLPAQFDHLRQVLSDRPSRGDVLFAYRIDGFFYPRQAIFAEIQDFIRQQGFGPPQPIWNYNYDSRRLPALDSAVRGPSAQANPFR